MKALVEKLRDHTGDPEGNFPNVFVFPGNGKVEKKYVMEFEYRKKNKAGEFQKKKEYLSLAISYNPFTGEKLDKAQPTNKEQPTTNNEQPTTKS